MRNFLLSAALILASESVYAGNLYDLQQTASSTTIRLIGVFKGYVSSLASATPAFSLDSLTGRLTARSIFTTYGVSAATITATGAVVSNSSVTASAFFGDASHMTGAIEQPTYSASTKTFTQAMEAASFTSRGQVTSIGSMTVTGSGGVLTHSSVTASAFFGDASHLTGAIEQPTYSASTKTFTQAMEAASFTSRGQLTSVGSMTVTGSGGILTGSSVTASAFFGDASHMTGVPTSGHTIATGSSAGPWYKYVARSTLTFDNSFFGVTDRSASNDSFVSLNVASNSLVQTRQVFLSGSGTYTTPAGVAQIRVREVGGGGGGAADNAIDGSNGTNTVFGSTTAYGGGRGLNNSGAPGAGGTGGSSSSVVVRVPGGLGSYSQIFANANGVSAPANSGLGGSGAIYGSGTRAGGSGGNGEYVEFLINSPAATYSYSVSTGGAGGVQAGDYDGGNGGSGYIIVDEFYPAIGPTGATGATGAAGANGVSFNGGWTATAPSGNVYLTTATNNVGIGTASPGATLHVAGTGIIVSSLTVGGYNVLGSWYDFTPSLSASGSMTTTGQTIVYAKYMRVGKAVSIDLYVYGVTLGGVASTDVYIAIPAGLSMSSTYGGITCQGRNNTTTWVPLFSYVTSSSIYMTLVDASNWTLGSDARFKCNGTFSLP